MTTHSSTTVFLPTLRAPQLCVAAMLAAVLLAGAPGGIWAAEPAAESPAPGTAGESAEAKSSPDAPTSAESSAEVFIPTEEISEDFAVSFPVDI